MRTTGPANGEIEISTSPGCEEKIFSLIQYLKEDGGIHAKEKTSY